MKTSSGLPGWLRAYPFLVTAGLVVGIALGLAYAWVISPVRYRETAPFSLAAEFKDGYRILIASAYHANGDLGRARARLGLLNDPDPAAALAAQAQRIVAGGASYPDARQLALLAAALGQNPVQETPSLFTPSPAAGLTAEAAETAERAATAPGETGAAASSATAGATAGLAATPAPLPTRTPTPTQRPPFVLKKASPMCDPNLGGPLIQVQVTDRQGKGVPGVQALVTWSGGQDSFFTGLKPQIGPGYADFAMTAGVQYTLRLADGGQPVENLAVADCPGTGGATYSGGWLVEFTQP